jgi:mannose-6-phosphate isomerase
MPKLDIPLQLSPVFKPKIWGQRDLSPLFPAAAVEAGTGELIGEAWLTDDASRFLTGPPAGLTLAEAVAKYGSDVCGRTWSEPRFPILTKYLYTSDWLSVQVHPDDDYARVHDPGSPGKCEMWYVVRAGRGAKILLGSKPGVSKQELRAAFESGTSRELLHAVRPRAGDAFFIPPGTVHALGPGLVLFEAEQNSDLTYRLDDYGRLGLEGKPRPLHIAKGLEVTRLDLARNRALPRLQRREAYGTRRLVVASRHFAVEELLIRRKASFESVPERVEIFSVLGGEGRVETSAGWLAFRTGETWLIPPETGKYRLVPEETARFLKVYVPDLGRDFREHPAKRGRLSREAAKLVFD